MILDFLTKVLPYLVALNLALTATSKILQALHTVSPEWLQTVIGGVQKVIDWVSANPAHPQPQTPPQQ